MTKRRILKYQVPKLIRSKDIPKKIQRGVFPSRANNVIKNKNNPKAIASSDKTDILKNIPRAKNEKVFIIGGGSSLINFDFSNLNGHDVIAVNKAIEHVNSAKYFITMDYTFLSKTNLSVHDINNKTESSYFVLNTGHDYIQNIGGVYTDTRNNIKYEKINQFTGVIPSKLDYNSTTGFGKTVNDFCHGSNSGYCALQFAILSGYKEIYLLGFDLNIDKGTHFHKGYKQASQKFRQCLMKYRSYFVKSFQLSNLKNVYSCSKNSFLNDYIKHIPFHIALRNTEKSDEVKQNEIQQEKKKMKGDLTNLMVVGYYTIKTAYEREARKLIASLNKLNLLHDISGVPNLGSWQANTRYKAQFMLDMMEKHPDKNLLYVDADAIIHKRPHLFVEYNCDVAVRWQDFRWRKNECLSGTIYMENNEKTKKLCKMWANINESEGKKAKTFEQWNLGSAIEKMKKEDGLIAKTLPAGYTYIFDIFRKLYPNEPIYIEHFQASRRLKNKI